MTHSKTHLDRRAVLSLSAAGALATTTGIARATEAASDTYKFELTLTDAEWRERLTEDQYYILRERGTEFPTSSPYWNVNNPGIYHCVGCDLPVYSSEKYSPQQIGFVFFTGSIDNNVLLANHKTDYNGALPMVASFMEPICRRCGGHLGHIVVIEGEALHCINGAALELKAA